MTNNNKEKTNIFSIVLAGGSGSRLWPLSREQYPKHLLKLPNQDTLIKTTILRLLKFTAPENITTSTNVKLATDVKLQLDELKNSLKLNKDLNMVIEPDVRNTLPAITLSVFHILNKLSKQTDPIILVAPSDHLIEDETAFANSIKQAAKLAEQGYLVTFGIKPTKPDTGFGYIKTEKSVEISNIEEQGLKVISFKEKPEIKEAVKFVTDPNSYWNSGIFMFKASVFLKELELFNEEIINKFKTVKFSEKGPTISFDDYEELPSTSIDYAVMENSTNAALIPLNCGWKDMGSWEEIYEIAEKDNKQNFISGNVVDIDSENSFVYSTSKLISTIGLKNTVIVETEDAILACDRSRTQDVKQIFDILKSKNNLSCEVHKTVYRPWGFYTVIQEGPGYKIKIIQVNPKARLSLQLHHRRSEHWVVLSGEAKVVRGEKEYILAPGGSIDIPKEAKHMLENPGETSLSIIEVQNGDYLEEDDIVRFNDLYGRTTV